MKNVGINHIKKMMVIVIFLKKKVVKIPLMTADVNQMKDVVLLEYVKSIVVMTSAKHRKKEFVN